jgi:hypothetical protein
VQTYALIATNSNATNAVEPSANSFGRQRTRYRALLAHREIALATIAINNAMEPAATDINRYVHETRKPLHPEIANDDLSGVV